MNPSTTPGCSPFLGREIGGHPLFPGIRKPAAPSATHGRRLGAIHFSQVSESRQPRPLPRKWLNPSPPEGGWPHPLPLRRARPDLWGPQGIIPGATRPGTLQSSGLLGATRNSFQGAVIVCAPSMISDNEISRRAVQCAGEPVDRCRPCKIKVVKSISLEGRGSDVALGSVMRRLPYWNEARPTMKQCWVHIVFLMLILAVGVSLILVE